MCIANGTVIIQPGARAVSEAGAARDKQGRAQRKETLLHGGGYRGTSTKIAWGRSSNRPGACSELIVPLPRRRAPGLNKERTGAARAASAATSPDGSPWGCRNQLPAGTTATATAAAPCAPQLAISGMPVSLPMPSLSSSSLEGDRNVNVSRTSRAAEPRAKRTGRTGSSSRSPIEWTGSPLGRSAGVSIERRSARREEQRTRTTGIRSRGRGRRRGQREGGQEKR